MRARKKYTACCKAALVAVELIVPVNVSVEMMMMTTVTVTETVEMIVNPLKSSKNFYP